MSTEVKVPVFPESITEGNISEWYKSEGDIVEEGETIVDIETDKVVMEVPAPITGKLGKILKQAGDIVTSKEVIGSMQAVDAASVKSAKTVEAPKVETPIKETTNATTAASNQETAPAVRRMLNELDINAAKVAGTGKHGRITPQDVSAHVQNPATTSAPVLTGERIEKRVPMTRLRKTISRRLNQAQQENVILTTFNEVDMHAIKEIRAKYKEPFTKKHGIKLGFMSFFLKATTLALQQFPAVNASVDGDDIVYHGYYDIGVAISSARGLVVPVVRNVDQMSFADIEQQIVDYAKQARAGKGALKLEDMQGGTFTITNGGTFGSMLSTPILNQPQSAILGMHNIVDRPTVVNGEIVIRPIMYLALSYDHRIIDGSESVQFLRTIKELLEAPERLLLNV
ncbi:MAG: dihydrolipoyllysine-residue succinyltransferase [Thiotrichales bacterium]|nr:MAG: dihydrolipoyllysine-residue succinyltransferase [Thiotrichales bacterium]